MAIVADVPKLWIPPRPAIVRAADRDIVREARAADLRMRRSRAGLVPFPFFRTAAPSFATRTQTASVGATSTTTSPSQSSVAVGSASGTSLVVVVFFAWNDGSNGTALSSISIDGGAATIHQNALGLAVASSCAICAVASRATANTSITISASLTQNIFSYQFVVYRLNGLTSATPDDSQKATTTGATTINHNVAVTNPGIVVAGAGTDFGSATLIALTGASQDVKGEYTTHGRQYVACSDQNQPTNATLNLAATWGTSNAGALAAATWH